MARKKYLPNDHECFMQPHKFLDEIAYDNAGQDEELIGKADALYKQCLQKSRTLFGTLRLLLLINKVVKATSSSLTGCSDDML